MGPIFALAMKDLRLLVRDKAGLFFACFFPVIYAAFFGSIMGGFSGGQPQQAIPLVVVDLDNTDDSREFIAELERKAVTIRPAATREEAMRRVRTGKESAYLFIPAGFGEASSRMFYGNPPRLELGVDPSKAATRGMLQGIILESSFKGMQEMFTDPAIARERIGDAIAQVESADDMTPGAKMILSTFLRALDGFLQQLSVMGSDEASDADEDAAGAGPGGWQPVALELTDVARQEVKRAGPGNPYEISFPQAILWGIMGCAAGFGISLVTERVRGTLVRLRMAPIAQRDILAGKALACFLTTTTVASLLLLFGIVVFGVRPDSVPLLILAVLSLSTCFVGVMMLLSVVGKTEAAAGGIGWAILTMLAMIGGGMIPLFVMPPWLLKVSHLSPVKWGIVSLEGAIWRGFSLGEMMVPCGILVAIGVVAFSLGTFVFQRVEA